MRSAEATLDTLGKAREAIDAVIFGQRDVVDLTLTTILRRWPWSARRRPGPRQDEASSRPLGTVLGLDARRVQFTPDLMPSDITGSGNSGGNGPRGSPASISASCVARSSRSF